MHDLVKALRCRLAAAPADLDNMRQLSVRATLVPGSEAELRPILASLESAAPALINEQGRPTIMRVDAWMCHADMVNLNGDAFIGEELQAIVEAGLFQAPDFGVMDWNHSAVLQWNEDPTLIGVWYGSSYEMDESVGKMGVRVQGMMFAWLFPEQANEMLADQERFGYVNFSMACMAKSVEFGTIDGRRAAILHNPTFFTNSALNKPPADPAAKGRVSEKPETWEEWPSDLQLANADADEYDQSADEVEVELDEAWDVSETKTNFPKAGDDKVVSLRNSNYRVFPLTYAQDLKENWPEIWSRGGNIRGNDQYRKLTPVVRRGGKVDGATEERAVRLREAWAARHYEDKRLNGVVAQIKWFVVGSQGLSAMKAVINEAKDMVKRQRAEAAARLAGQQAPAPIESPTLRAAAHEHSADAQESQMEIDALKAQLAEAQGLVGTLTATVKEKDEAIAAASEKVTALQDEVAKLTAKAQDAELSVTALSKQLEDAQGAFTALETELSEVKAQLSTYEQREAEVAQKARLAERIAELPEPVRQAHDARDEDAKAKAEARWIAYSDEEWVDYLAEMKSLFPEGRLAMAARTAREGGALPGGTDPEADALQSEIRSLIKKTA